MTIPLPPQTCEVCLIEPATHLMHKRPENHDDRARESVPMCQPCAILAWVSDEYMTDDDGNKAPNQHNKMETPQ